jgi:hypothetical protein
MSAPRLRRALGAYETVLVQQISCPSSIEFVGRKLIAADVWTADHRLATNGNPHTPAHFVTTKTSNGRSIVVGSVF